MKKITLICTLANLLILRNPYCYCQNVGISAGGSTPNASALLDVDGTNKGLLIPRVSLTSTTDAATIASPATSLLVYNTNATMTNGSGTGFYYNAGTTGSPNWVSFTTTSNTMIQNMQVFNSSGSFTVPAGVTKIMVEVWGGGGGGYNGLGSSASGGGGGGGYGKDIFTVTPGAVYAVTVGGAGSTGFPGTAGGTSSFGALISATGGAGAGAGGGGGAGGTSTATFKSAGSKGSLGYALYDASCGCAAYVYGIGGVSATGHEPGGGGDAGAAGIAGRVVVWW